MTSPPSTSSNPSRPLSGSSSSSSPSSRPIETPTEILYNTAVQSFVRRDHLKTHASLSRLLSTLKADLRTQPRKRWYDLTSAPGGNEETEEWLIKTLKLSISAHASLFTDPPPASPTRPSLPPAFQELLPPHPPRKILEVVHAQCKTVYVDGILPPPVLSTLILAAFKLQPASDALETIHKIIEEWLEILPDDFIRGIARRGNVGRRVESAREGYLKVLELFTEVLCREGEYEMARGLLDGDTLLGGKQKEALYRHIRASQARREQPSLSNSGILPSPSGSLVLPEQSGSQRSPSHTGSTSGSEDTARPTGVFPALTTDTRSRGSGSTFIPRGKGKGRAKETETTDSESTLPSRIFVSNGNGTAGPSKGDEGNGRDLIRRRLLGYLSPVLGHLPTSWRNAVWGMSNAQLASLSLPLPLLAVLFLFAMIRRRQRRRNGMGIERGAAVIAGTAGLNYVRARLEAMRRRGLWQWIVWCFKWWADKFVGVWTMGTTITYV